MSENVSFAVIKRQIGRVFDQYPAPPPFLYAVRVHILRVVSQILRSDIRGILRK